MKKIIFILISFLTATVGYSQADSQKTAFQDTSGGNKPVMPITPKKEPTQIVSPAKDLGENKLGNNDTILAKDKLGNGQIANKKVIIDSIYVKLLNNPFYRSRLKPMYLVIDEKKRQSKDEMFYILLIVLALLALLKLGFSKYFQHLFQQLYQPSFRQKQTREQLSQNNFPSLMLNLFFVLSAGAFIALLMEYYNLTKADFGTNLLYSAGILLLLNAGKYLFLTLTGWLFQSTEATDTYLSVVFLVNKILGIVLLPFLFIIAFASQAIIHVAVTIALMVVILLFLYRYIASVSPIRREIKISIFHFLLYVLALEIIPLLVIYKLLSNYLIKST